MQTRKLAFVLLIIALLLVLGVTGFAAYTLLVPPNQKGLLGGKGNATATPPTQATNGPVISGQGCGVKKNSDGTYTFSWLHVTSNGQIVDQNNCAVPLAGFNMGPLFLSDAVGGSNPARFAWYKQNFSMNIVRTNFNSTWWNENVYVPNAHMHFQQWLETYVKWQEQQGNYVLLDNGPNYPEPPCGGTITHCPPQNQGSQDYKTNPNATTALELESNIQPGVQAWHDIAKIYANDPAVLYDAWNEPTISNLPTFFKDMNTLINTIRSVNPRSLVVVYERGWKYIVAGQYADYQQPNLVIDSHIYDGFHGISPLDGSHCVLPGSANPVNPNLQNAVNFAHSHGQAFMVGEWGGCYDIPAYNNQLVAFAKANNIPLLYFQAGNVITNGKQNPPQMNANGQLVQQSYKMIIGGV